MHISKKTLIKVGIAAVVALIVALLAGYSKASADDPVDDSGYVNDEPCTLSNHNWCNSTGATDSGKSGPTVSKADNLWDRNSVQAGLIDSLTAPDPVPVTSEDWDPDNPDKLATECELLAERKIYHQAELDKIERLGDVNLPIWRNTKIDNEFIYRSCARRIDSTTWHYWYRPWTHFLSFTMDEKDIVGLTPAYACEIFQGIRVSADARDGYGRFADGGTFTVPCHEGLTGWSNYQDFPNRPRLRWKSPFGYPKGTAINTHMLNGAPDPFDSLHIHYNPYN